MSKARVVGRAGCVSRAVIRCVPLDQMLPTRGRGVKTGCLWTTYNPQN